MSNEWPYLLIVLILFGSLSFAFGASIGQSDLKREAVERGYALYCPNNGEWAWKGECDE